MKYHKVIWCNIVCYIRKIYLRIKRFVDYAPLIWCDEDWDHGYILKMLCYKIRRHRQYLVKFHHHVGWKHDVKNMLIAEQTLDRMMKDDYARKEWSQHWKRWPHRGWGIEQPDGNTRIEWRRGERKDVGRIFKLEQQRKHADWKFLFNHLYKHLEEWWD